MEIQKPITRGKTSIKRVLSLLLSLTIAMSLVLSSGLSQFTVLAANGDPPKQFTQSISISGKTVTLSMEYKINGEYNVDQIWWWFVSEDASFYVKVFPTSPSPASTSCALVDVITKRILGTDKVVTEGWVTEKEYAQNFEYFFDSAFRAYTKYTVKFDLPADLPGGRFKARACAINRNGDGTIDIANNDAEMWSKANAGITNATYIADISAAAVIINPTSFAYNGISQSPSVSVKYGNKVLTEGIDYDVTRPSDSINSGEKTITITGKGYYTGTIKKTYNISKANIADAVVTGISGSGYPYTGSTIEPTLTVKYGNITLKQGTDYTVTYANNINAGTSSYTITGTGQNFSGTKQGSFVITSYTIKAGDISEIPDQTYTVSQIKPPAEVKAYGKPLTEGTDYTLSYGANINVGTGTVTVHGMNNFAAAPVSKTFKIARAPIDIVKISSFNDVIYSGSQFTPLVTAEYYGKPLTLNQDYTVDYKDNINVGTAKVLITGINNYSGTRTEAFKILAVSDTVVTLTPDKSYYTGSSITPTVSVRTNTTALIPGTDYNVSYSNNTNAGTATVTVNITNVNYGGPKTITKNFTILPANISEAAALVGNGTDYKYTGEPVRPALTVTFNGKTLTSPTAYEAVYTNNTNAGTATITVKGSGNFTGEITKQFSIFPVDIADENADVEVIGDFPYDGEYHSPSVKKVSVGVKQLRQSDYSIVSEAQIKAGTYSCSVKGCGNYTGTIQIKNCWRIRPNTALDLTLDKYEFDYDGMPKSPQYTVKCGTKILAENTDYSVVSNGSNTKAGTYDFKIEGIVNYGGVKTVTYTINPSQSFYIRIENSSFEYDGNSKSPVIKLLSGNTVLQEGVDYELSGEQSASSTGEHIVTASGKGNYAGKKYASWFILKSDPKKFIIGVDTFNFLNTGYDFYKDWDENGYFNYEIKDDYYKALTYRLVPAEEGPVFEERFKEWHGSCFGLAVLTSLQKAGKIDLDYYQPGASQIHHMDPPNKSFVTASLINYYQLLQHIPSIKGKLLEASGKSAVSLNKSLIDSVNSSAFPVVATFTFEAASGPGGHAITAYKTEISSDGSHLVYFSDSNNNAEDTILEISKEYDTAKFIQGTDKPKINEECRIIKGSENIWYNNKLKLGTSFKIDEPESILAARTHDKMEKELQDSNQPDWLFTTTLPESYIEVNYPDFYIAKFKNGIFINGAQAEVLGGKVVASSSEIGIKDGIARNETKQETELLFKVNNLQKGEYYIIYPNADTGYCKQSSGYVTKFTYTDTKDGFYASIESQDRGQYYLYADGTVATDFNNRDTQQTLTVASNSTNNMWFNTSISTSSSSIRTMTAGSNFAFSSASSADVICRANNEVKTEELSVNIQGNRTYMITPNDSVEQTPNNFGISLIDSGTKKSLGSSLADVKPLGDTNGDYKVDLRDVIALKETLKNNTKSVSLKEYNPAKVSSKGFDGVVNALDLVYLKRMLNNAA